MPPKKAVAKATPNAKDTAKRRSVGRPRKSTTTSTTAAAAARKRTSGAAAAATAGEGDEGEGTDARDLATALETRIVHLERARGERD